MGLRAKQKADRRRRILDAAAKLFHETGFDAARIEDIAERAEVSVGTVYNYFDTKGDILVATVAIEVEEVLAQGALVIDNPPSNVGKALDRLIAGYYDHSLTYLSKQMWRTAVALSIQHPEATFSKVYSDLDQRLCQQVSALMERLRVDGIVRADVDTRAVGEMIFANLNMMFIEYVKDEQMALDVMKLRVIRQNRPLARLISTARL